MKNSFSILAIGILIAGAVAGQGKEARAPLAIARVWKILSISTWTR